MLNRRSFIGLMAFAASGLPGAAHAAVTLTFDELYATQGVLGLKFTEKVKSLSGQDVVMRGFMAPPLKAEAKFFVLTEIPMALCPFCSSDADWPESVPSPYRDGWLPF